MMRIPQWKPAVGEEEIEAVIAIVRSGWLSEHTATREFEQTLAKIVHRKYAVAVSSGGVALFLALKAVGISAGDEVICPDYQMIALANAITLANARPVFVDVSTDDANILCEAIETKITNKTRAIFPIHMNGRAVNMALLNELASKYALALIDDACQGLGSCYQDQEPLGSGRFGSVASCFSFHPSKIVTTVTGGAVVTDSEELALKVKGLKDYGHTERGSANELSDHYEQWGFNFRFSELHAAIGIKQLSSLQHRLEHVREVHRLYGELIAKYHLKPLRNYVGFTPWCSDIQFKVPFHNQKVKRRLSDNYGIETRLPYRPMHLQPLFRSEKSSYDGATTVWSSGLWLPTAHVSLDEVQYIAESLNQVSGDESG